MAEDFTFANVRVVAQAIADYLKAHNLNKREILTGYDARFLSEHFAETVAEVMIGNGIPTLIAEEDLPTPVLAFAVKDRKAAGAVMITASHNPPEYNGIKFIPEYAGPAFPEITEEIEKNIAKNPEVVRGRAAPQRIHLKSRYIKDIQLLVDSETIKSARLKIIYDPMYGSGRRYLDKILQDFGCRVETIHDHRDVLFGGRLPEPVEENLGELKAKVREEKADLGLATDGDSDRFGVVDETGKFFSANQIVALIFDYLIEKGLPGGVVRTVGTTHLIDRIAKLHKVKVYETPVGFKYIAEKMMKENILLGGEESGGLSIKGHIPEKDGILANLLVAEMVASRKKPLSEIWEKLITKVGPAVSKTISLEVPKGRMQKMMDKLLESPPAKIEQVTTLDGLKLIFADSSWMLARPSGTEPLLRLYFEAESEDKVQKLKEAVTALL